MEKENQVNSNILPKNKCHILSSFDNKVFDICGGVDFVSGETKIIVYGKHGGNNQQWIFRLIDETYFNILSFYNTDYAITVKENSVVIDLLKDNDDRQVFYLQEVKEKGKENTKEFIFINKYFQSPINCSENYKLYCGEPNEEIFKLFHLEVLKPDYLIISCTNDSTTDAEIVLDCRGGHAISGTEIISWAAHYGKNQIFHIINTI